MKRTLCVLLISLLLVVSSGFCVNADVVFFVDGRLPVEGTVSESGGKVIVEKADGTKVEFNRGDVSTIEKGTSLMIMYYGKLAKITLDDLRSVFDLAVWCEKVGLTDKKAVLFIEILKRDPDSELVHEHLGHVRRGGKWMNPLLGEEFGDNIPNTLKSGSFADKKGKYFTVRTDTSAEFADFTVKYLDEFCAKLESCFDDSLSFKSPSTKPVIIILANYDEYVDVTNDFIKIILPDEESDVRGENKGPGEDTPPSDRPEKKKRFIMPPYSCFLDPLSKMLVTYRYNKKPKVPPLRENIQKLAGYGMYIFGLGGYANASKSPRFLVEGFASVIGLSDIVNSRLEVRNIPRKMASSRALIPEHTISYLFKIDPLSYYMQDMSPHSAASMWATYFMLNPIQGMPDAYYKAIRQDTSGTLLIESFSRLVGKIDIFERDWRNFCDSAFIR